MRRAAIIVGFVFASVFMSSAAWAQLPPDSSLTIGGRLWVTSGYSLHSISRSELRWKGVDSVVPELYVAFGATSGFPSVVAAISSNAKVITQDYYWHSLRLGGRTQVPLFGGLSLKGRAFLVPWSYSIIDDIHHRRSELRHDPSFHGEASGGLGVQADGGLTYQVWRGLSVEVGYQYWRVKSGEGTETASFTSGDVDTRLLENRTERYGPYVGVQYRF